MSPSPKGADADLAAAVLAAGPEVAEIATTADTKRGELLGAATPKLWLDGSRGASGSAILRWRAPRGELLLLGAATASATLRRYS